MVISFHLRDPQICLIMSCQLTPNGSLFLRLSFLSFQFSFFLFSSSLHSKFFLQHRASIPLFFLSFFSNSNETNFSIQTIPTNFSIQTISKISDPLLCFSLSFSIRFFINGIAHHSSALSFVDLALLLINGVAHCLSAFLVEKRRENHRKTKGEKQGKNEEKRREKRRGE